MSEPIVTPTQPPNLSLRVYHLLAAVPALGMLGGLSFANDVGTLVLGLPFLLIWIIAWVLATPVCMAIIYALDQHHQPALEAHGKAARP